ncbi:MAG: hypothetical protein M1816_000334 [Peltula sp. TS41687]|nr:MAG: hypothetical protein M1816_000334 [Peltula sp. TS41687]
MANPFSKPGREFSSGQMIPRSVEKGGLNQDDDDSHEPEGAGETVETGDREWLRESLGPCAVKCILQPLQRLKALWLRPPPEGS